MAIVIELEHTSPVIVSVVEAKKQLQIETDFTEDDTLIESYIDAAINWAENYINSEISEKKFRCQGKSFDDALQFNLQKIQSVDEFKYKNVAGDEVVIAAANYSLQRVDKFENKITFNDDYVFPEVKEYDPTAVIIDTTVGYATGKVPKAIKQAILLKITDLYEHRTDSVKEKATAAESLLHPYKRY